MNLDFALKDFYRKRKQNFPYVLAISLVVGFAEYFTLFTLNIGFRYMIPGGNTNNSLLLGGIGVLYSQFNNLIFYMVIALSVVVTTLTATTFILSKKRDLAIMRSLGTLPGNLHGFYLVEVIVIFFFSYAIGLMIGLVSFGIHMGIAFSLGLRLQIQSSMIYSLIHFCCCFSGVIILPGWALMKLGKQNIIKSFSKDMQYDYDASKKMELVPRWLSRFGYNLKMALINTIRRKGEFKRYMLIFSTIFAIIFSIGLGSFVMGTSTSYWIKNAQGEHVVVIGHENTVRYYSQMYRMFSDPSISVGMEDINFTNKDYLFDFESLSELELLSKIQLIDKRLVSFCNITEATRTYGITIENPLERTYGFATIGSSRTGYYPVIGVNPEALISNFEIEGEFLPNNSSVVVGDGLASQFFDDALKQGIKINNFSYGPRVSGIVIDSLYGGFAVYVNLSKFQSLLGYATDINLILLKLDSALDKTFETNLKSIINNNLGSNFTYRVLDDVFNENLNFLIINSLYPLIFIAILGCVGLLCLYNYQKGGLVDKARDIQIMRAIGIKNKHARRILFFEVLFVVVPSLLLSLALGMILNALFLFDRVQLPSIIVPFVLILVLGGFAFFFSYLGVIPIVKKINQVSIKNYEVF
ncbi:MAG: ABC transporter permease [Candidatus Lokiarchaeota archaeon]|nr:ABC transporter permease [Candidatus Lokiarchaeota archaeon]